MTAPSSQAAPDLASLLAGVLADLGALYDRLMADCTAHRDIALGAEKGSPKRDVHMRTAIAFKNRAAGVSEAMSVIEATAALSALTPDPAEEVAK